VNGDKNRSDEKTSGSIAVTKHRPVMNKLNGAARRRLRQRAAELLYGNEPVAHSPFAAPREIVRKFFR